MKIIIKTTNIDLTPSLKDYAEKKIGELEKFLQRIGEKGQDFEKGKPSYEAWVELERTTHHHHKGKVFRAECQIRLPGRSLRAESIKEDMYLAIDEVKDELQGEIDRYKQKQVSRYKRMARRIKNFLLFR
ncbi:MAG: ribosome-associated translation inhibitor RaiA [Candidatus Nealsonbacteria bacterium]|nr:ribosome-associated translation inhibitor RaiA [Candidatus Nealsonbacteria bacterium]